MRWLRAVAIACAAFSRIPMPHLKWEDSAMKLSIAFWPIVGIPVGVAVMLWQWLCRVTGLGPVLFAAVAVALPILITGGIHLDGFCDTADALAAHADKERSLAILKDANIGAFAAIHLGLYYLISFAVWHELYVRELTTGLVGVFVLSRCFATACCLLLPAARPNGMLVAFRADSKKAGLILVLLSVPTVVFWLITVGVRGGVALAACIPVTWWYVSTSKKRFGGITGDTTGCYNQIAELALLAGLLAGGLVL